MLARKEMNQTYGYVTSFGQRDERYIFNLSTGHFSLGVSVQLRSDRLRQNAHHDGIGHGDNEGYRSQGCGAHPRESRGAAGIVLCCVVVALGSDMFVAVAVDVDVLF